MQFVLRATFAFAGNSGLLAIDRISDADAVQELR